MGQTPSVSMDACVALQASVRAGSRHRRRGRTTRSSLPRLTLISASVLLAFASSQESFGLPTGEALNPSQVTVARPSQSQMVINQSTNKALINWQGFSIGAGESVNVKQPSAGSVLLNRVVGPQASDISGQLTANGQVFVLNPNGITFGPKARVDVGGLVASTLRLTDEDFYAGRYQFTGGAGAGSVRVESGARLNAQERGFVALIGGQVSNAGTVTANLGTVALAAGDKVKLDFAGDGLIQLKVDAAALNAEVANQGAIIANGGKATMTVAAANAVGKTVINQTGIVRAQTLVERNGRIVLESVGGGDVMASGELDARGVQAGTTGGTVQLLGERVGVTQTARIDASGDSGGGTVQVGGSFQGKDPTIRNANATYVGPQTLIATDATRSGKGGNVVVWSDGPTRAHGRLSAQGGPQGGDGGSIETSGKSLDTSGVQVSAGAPSGAPGAWLLDPSSVTITTTAPTSVGAGPDFTAINSNSTVNVADIQNALISSNVTISTVASILGDPIAGTGDITWESGANLAKSSQGDRTLTLNADRNIFLQGPLTIESTVGSLGLTLNARQTGAALGSIDIAPGVRLITLGGDVILHGGAKNLVDGASAITIGASLGSAQTLPVFIDTRGPNGDGSVTMRADMSPASGSADGILARGLEIHTGNGSVTLSGTRVFADSESDLLGGVELRGVTIDALDGDIDVIGRAPNFSTSGIGVRLEADVLAGVPTRSLLSSQSGTITVSGISAAQDGVVVRDTDLQTQTGRILLSGHAGDFGFSGVNLGAGAKITKSGGTGAAVLQVNSNGDLIVGPAVEITSDAGPLDVNFNARPLDFGEGEVGAIVVNQNVAISTRGGNIRFYGGATKDDFFVDGDQNGSASFISLGCDCSAPRTKLDTHVALGSSQGGVITMKADSLGIVAHNTDISAGSGGISLIGQFIGNSEGTGNGVDLILTALDSSGPIHIEGSIDRTSGFGVHLQGTTITSVGAQLADADPLVSIIGTVLSSASGVGVRLEVDVRTPEGAEGPVTTGTRVQSGPGNVRIEGAGSVEELAVETSGTELVTGTGTLEVRDESEGGVLLGTGTLVRKTADSSAAVLRVISPVSIDVADKVEVRSDGGALNLFFVGGDPQTVQGATVTPGVDVLTIGSGVSINTQGGNVTWLANSTSVGASASVRTQGGSMLVAGSVADQETTIFYGSSITFDGVPATAPILLNTEGIDGAAGGSVRMFADDGLLLVGTQVAAGSGRVDLAGNQRVDTAVSGLELRGVQITATGNGSVELFGSQRSVSSPGVGIRIISEGATRTAISTEFGGLSIAGNVFPGKANPLAVEITQTDLQTNSGVVRVVGGDGQITAPGVPSPDPVTAIGNVLLGTGTVINKIGTAGVGALEVQSVDLVTVAANVQITAQDGPLNVALHGNRVVVGDGVDITTLGGAVEVGQAGVDGSGNAVLLPAASIRVNGSGDPDGTVIDTRAAADGSSGGPVTMLAATDGIVIDRATIRTGSGKVTLNGVLVVDNTEGSQLAGVELVGAVVETVAGDISITGNSLSSSIARPGVWLRAFDSDGVLTRSRITTAGGAIDLKGTSGNGTGVQVANSDLETQTGRMTLIGATSAPASSNGVLLEPGTVVTKLDGSTTVATLQIDSSGDISVGEGVQFASLLGSLNVALNALPVGAGTIRPSRISLANLVEFLTGGGSVTLYGEGNPASGAAGSISLVGVAINTKPLAGTGPGGAVVMRAGTDGLAVTDSLIRTQGAAVTLDGTDTTGNTTTGVTLVGTTVDAGAGSVTIRGRAGPAPSGTKGVSIAGRFSDSPTADITGGAVLISGIASASSSSGDSVGVDLFPLAITSSGAITLQGASENAPFGNSIGLRARRATFDAQGNESISGKAQGAGSSIGVELTGAAMSSGGSVTVDGTAATASTGRSAGVRMVALDDGEGFLVAATTAHSGREGLLIRGTADGTGATGGDSVGVEMVGVTLGTEQSNLVIKGTAGFGATASTGVDMRAFRASVRGGKGSTVEPDSGSVSIVGVGGASGGESIGTALRGTDIQPRNGSVVVLGRAAPSPSGSAGVRMESDFTLSNESESIRTVVSAPAPGARIALAGSSEGATASANDWGISVLNSTIGNATSTADIFLLALATGRSEVIEVDATGSIATKGGVNVRPGGVTPQGQVHEETETPIQIGGPAAGAGLLVPVSFLTSISGPPARVVIGSDRQTGQITVAETLDVGWDLTLENAGAGSAGILIDGPVHLPANTLALVSAGPVRQSAAGGIRVASLALRGYTIRSDFELPAGPPSSTGREVLLAGAEAPDNQLLQDDAVFESGRLAAYSDGGLVRFVANGRVDLSPVTWTGATGGSEAWTLARADSPWKSERIGRAEADTEQGPTTFQANHSFMVKAVGGNLVLDPDIVTTTGDILLSTTGVFVNVGAPTSNDPAVNVPAKLLPGGRFQVNAGTWRGETRGNVAGSGNLPNQFACPSGDCGSSSGNSFVYADQPDATITFGTILVPFGVPVNQAISPQTSGLILGDSLAAIFGTGGGTFDPASLGFGQLPAPGRYSINPTIDSPAGYKVTVIPGQLVVAGRDAVTPGDYYPPDVTDATLPRMCTTTAPALVAYSTLPDGDYLDLDWSRSRQRLTLTSCTGLRLKDSCSDF